MTDKVHKMEATVLVTPEVLREVNTKMRVFCDVTPHSLLIKGTKFYKKPVTSILKVGK